MAEKKCYTFTFDQFSMLSITQKIVIVTPRATGNRHTVGNWQLTNKLFYAFSLGFFHFVLISILPWRLFFHFHSYLSSVTNVIQTVGMQAWKGREEWQPSISLKESSCWVLFVTADLNFFSRGFLCIQSDIDCYFLETPVRQSNSDSEEGRVNNRSFIFTLLSGEQNS